MAARSWRWLRVRLLGLLTAPPSAWREERVDSTSTRLVPVYATRVQTVLFPSS